MPRRYKNRRAWDGHGGGWAGESSRCEDPAPTVGVCGDALARRVAIPMSPLPSPPRAYHAAHGNPRFYNRSGMGRAGTQPFAAVSLLEYCGLQPILPFLGGRSDAACRIVMKTVGLHGWKVRRAWDGYGGGVGGQLSVPPLPRYDSQSRQWVEMRFSAAKPHIRRSVFSVPHFSLPLRENCELCCCTGSAFGATVRCYG